MKRLSISFFVLLLMSVSLFAQSAARPTQEQSLQELVKEVRQLRATLQRMNAAVYKGQVLLEQLKLQQDQVTRISRELRDTRDTVSDLRAQQSRLSELFTQVEKEVEAGVKQDAERTNLKAEIEIVNQRAQRLTARETQLADELEAERAKLNELNSKLNMLLEHELSPR